VDEATIISEYALEQAIEDGVLVEVFKPLAAIEQWKANCCDSTLV
jgi:type I site-specific restriction endonuclease